MIAIAIASGVVDLVLVAIIAVYLLLDAPRIRVRIVEQAARSHPGAANLGEQVGIEILGSQNRQRWP